MRRDCTDRVRAGRDCTGRVRAGRVCTGRVRSGIEIYQRTTMRRIRERETRESEWRLERRNEDGRDGMSDGVEKLLTWGTDGPAEMGRREYASCLALVDTSAAG